MGDQDSLLAIIGRLYDAAADQARWPEVLNDIADVVGGMSCHFVVWNTATNSIPLMHTTRTDPFLMKDFKDHYINVNPWAGPFLSCPSGAVVFDHELTPRVEVERSEFFNDHLRRRKVGYALGAIVLKDGVEVSTLTVYRSAGHGPFDEHARQIGSLLVPHLQRAVQISRKLVGAQSLAGGAADALDRMPYGVLLLNSDGKILHANRFALEVLAQRDGLYVEQGELCAASASELQGLRRQILAATGREVLATAPGALNVSRPSMARPYTLLVSALPSDRHDLFDGLKPRAVVFVSDAERAGAAPVAVLQRLYRLTKKEAEVALMIAQGQPLRTIAEGMALSLETVRTHLKRVLHKTGTNRQTELVRLILSGPSQIRPE